MSRPALAVVALVALVGCAKPPPERFVPTPYVSPGFPGECGAAFRVEPGQVVRCHGVVVPHSRLGEILHRAEQADRLEEVYNDCADRREVLEDRPGAFGLGLGLGSGAAAALLLLLLL